MEKAAFAFIILAALLLAGCVNVPATGAGPSTATTWPSQSPIAPVPATSPTALTKASIDPAEKIVSGDVGGQNWDGNVTVNGSAFVPQGKTLTVLPGATVQFVHCRDYRGSCQKSRLDAFGTLTAVGTPQQPIRFTSDARKPVNGDWGMIHLEGSTHSRIAYSIVEFGQQGINLWKSDARIDHDIVRWNNWEGLYAESYSTPLIEYNRVYQNGYNGMALEQFNDAQVRFNEFRQSGTNGLHVDASTVNATGNVISDNHAFGLSLDDNAHVVADGNFIDSNGIAAVNCGEGQNQLQLGSNWIQGELRCQAQNHPMQGSGEIDFGWATPEGFELGYTPGDRQKDRYAYVYPDDETRTAVKKLGEGKGLLWSVAVDGKTIWAVGVSGDAHQYDVDSGNELTTFQVSSPQPWGATFLDGKLWITDFAEKRTYSVDPATGKELYSFENPDQERGAKGLANDGTNLLLMGWTTGTIYKLDTTGKLLDTVQLSEPLGGGGLAFDGRHYWVPCGDICEYDLSGRYLGKIYAASEGTWDLEWDADRQLLWATQRTNENWDDAKVYALKIGKTVS